MVSIICHFVNNTAIGIVRVCPKINFRLRGWQYQYPFTKRSENYYYEFYSEGPKGKIKKVVQFYRIEEFAGVIFNLAFGDWNDKTNRIDDINTSDNKDREKILATVAATVLQFTSEHPDAIIFAEGTTQSRNRLYQIRIAKILDQIDQEFEIEGLIDGKWERFQRGRNYDSFLFKRI
jgi:hypothetical protein